MGDAAESGGRDVESAPTTGHISGARSTSTPQLPAVHEQMLETEKLRTNGSTYGEESDRLARTNELAHALHDFL